MSASATQGGHNNTNIMLGTYSQKGRKVLGVAKWHHW